MAALFSEKEQDLIRQAIEDAEKETSGEIRVCAEKYCKTEPLERASSYFLKIGMDKTAHRNGVLIYIATEDHKFAVIGDKGINELVPSDFWDSTRHAMAEKFRKQQLAEGLVAGIRMAGEKLRVFFPAHDSDKNELSNDIAYL